MDWWVYNPVHFESSEGVDACSWYILFTIELLNFTQNARDKESASARGFNGTAGNHCFYCFHKQIPAIPEFFTKNIPEAYGRVNGDPTSTLVSSKTI